MTFLATTVRTARTPKRCLLCQCSIRPGQRYNDARFANEGSAYAWPSHQFCLWLVDHLDLWDPWERTVDPGALLEYYRDVTPPWDDPLHRLATVIGWWAQWQKSP